MSGERVGEELSDPERQENLDAVQDRGWLSERGWRSGRKAPEKERWFNYASGGLGDGKMGSSWAANGNV
jgi:hypothetical protein